VAALDCDASAYFIRRYSRDANDFIPASLAGRYGNGGTRNLQNICEEFNARLIRSAVSGGRRQGQFHCAADLSDKRILFSTWLHPDSEGRACGCVPNRNHKLQFHHRVTEPQRTFNDQIYLTMLGRQCWAAVNLSCCQIISSIS
jgi:hypothetical protein